MAEYVGLSIDVGDAPGGLEAFRQRHIHHPGKSVPFHTGLVSGICPREDLTDELTARVSQTCRSVMGFDYEAVCVNAFPSNFVLWLAPIPVTPFENLVGRIYEAFPHIPHEWRFPTFHMTIGISRSQEEMYEALAEFQRDLGGLLPLRLRASDVSLWVQEGEEFRLHSNYPLGS